MIIFLPVSLFQQCTFHCLLPFLFSTMGHISWTNKRWSESSLTPFRFPTHPYTSTTSQHPSIRSPGPPPGTIERFLLLCISAIFGWQDTRNSRNSPREDVIYACHEVSVRHTCGGRSPFHFLIGPKEVRRVTPAGDPNIGPERS